MFPSWARGMAGRGAILAGVCLVLVGVVCLVNGSLGQDGEGPVLSAGGKKTSPTIIVSEPKSIPIGAATTHDGATTSGKGPALPGADAKSSADKPFSLSAAVTLVENAGKGEVVKAEKSGEGSSARFSLEAIGSKGERLRFVVNPNDAVAGGVLEAKAPGDALKPSADQPITVGAAITMVENAGKGEVVKGEKSGAGAGVQFNLDVIDSKGYRTRFVVNATGKVMVAVEYRTIVAAVKSVDAATGDLTVTVGTKIKKDKSYNVPKNASITIDGKDAKLADLKAGVLISIAVDEGNAVIQIRTTVTGRGKKGGERGK